MTLRPILTMKMLFLSGCMFSLLANTPDSPSDKEDTQVAEMYIRTYLKTAIDEMERIGMPASVIIAQGMLESAYGQSELAQKANNHFGIKCGSWVGPPYYHRTKEFKAGEMRSERACFRSYDDVVQSYKDHSEHIKAVSNYADLFKSNTLDYKYWAKGLLQAGYASDPEYANKLISLIERYDLARYDKIANKYRLPDEKRIDEFNADPTIETQQDLLALNTRIHLLENTIVQALQLQKELNSLQKELKTDIQNLQRTQQSDKDILNSKLNALDQNMMSQAGLIEEMQSELDKVTSIQKSILKADPLSCYFNQDGTAKKQLDIFPTRHRNRDGIFYQSGRKATTLTEGQNFEDIARVYGVDIKDLRRFNDLLTGEEQGLSNGAYIYLEPKANMAIGESGPHTVQPGESLYSISQRYGVKITKLYARNNLKKGEEPVVGEFIFLNETAEAKPRVRVATENTVTDNTDRFGGGGN